MTGSSRPPFERTVLRSPLSRPQEPQKNNPDGPAMDFLPEIKFAPDLLGAFLSKRLLLWFAHVLVRSGRGRLHPVAAIQFPERAEGSRERNASGAWRLAA